MKKTVSIVLIAVFLALSLSACQTAAPASSAPAPAAPAPSAPAVSSQPTPAPEKIDIRIAGLRGATSIGLVKVMEDNEAGKAANN